MLSYTTTQQRKHAQVCHHPEDAQLRSPHNRKDSNCAPEGGHSIHQQLPGSEIHNKQIPWVEFCSWNVITCTQSENRFTQISF